MIYASHILNLVDLVARWIVIHYEGYRHKHPTKKRNRRIIPRDIAQINMSSDRSSPLMFAQRELLCCKHFILQLHKCTPLCHQLQPQPLRLLHRQREVVRLVERLFLSLHFLPPPVRSLRWHIRRRDDPDIWVDQEKSNDLAVARFIRVHEPERLHLVLEDVGEGEEAPLACFDLTDVLHGRSVIFHAENCGEPGVVVLLIAHLERLLGVDALAEGKVTRGDVVVVVVVE